MAREGVALTVTPGESPLDPSEDVGVNAWGEGDGREGVRRTGKEGWREEGSLEKGKDNKVWWRDS